VSVGKDDGVDGFGIEVGKAAVDFVGVFPTSLIESAIE